MPAGIYLLPIVLITGGIAAVKAKKLTVTGAVTAAFIGVFLFMGAGFYGILLAASVFLMAAVATSYKTGIKEALGVAEKNSGQRTAAQVLANVGTAGLLGLLCFFYPVKIELLRLMMAASLASAAADTISSEMGTVFGRRFYNIISFKKDQKGLNGVISLEGTLFGVAASVVIALVYSLSFGWNINFWWIILAGTIGNLADSVLGATLERKGFLGNNAVNFLNTVIAATVALVLFILLISTYKLAKLYICLSIYFL